MSRGNRTTRVTWIPSLNFVSQNISIRSEEGSYLTTREHRVPTGPSSSNIGSQLIQKGSWLFRYRGPVAFARSYVRSAIFSSVAEPRSYGEILQCGHVLGRDFRVAFGDSKIELCLLIAPHGGGIEPGSSEIMRAVADVGGWAWYEFAGFLRKGNKEVLHISSTDFDEPTLKSMLPQAGFVIAFHGASESREPIVYVGGKWKLGRHTVIESINGAFRKHGIRAADAIDNAVAAHLRGLDDSNITNLGKRAEGIQTSNFVGSSWKRSVETIRLAISNSSFCHSGRPGCSSPHSSASRSRSWDTVTTWPVSQSTKEEDSSICISKASTISFKRTVAGMASKPSYCPFPGSRMDQ